MSVCFPSKRGLRRDAKETVTIEIARARNVAPWSWGRMIGRFHNDRNYGRLLDVQFVLRSGFSARLRGTILTFHELSSTKRVFCMFLSCRCAYFLSMGKVLKPVDLFICYVLMLVSRVRGSLWGSSNVQQFIIVITGNIELLTLRENCDKFSPLHVPVSIWSKDGILLILFAT